MTLGFSICSIMSSTNSDSLTFSLLVWMTFISFPCLIAMSQTSNAILNKCGSSQYSFFFVPDFRGKSISFSPLTVMLGVVCAFMALLCWYMSPHTNFNEYFYHKCIVNFVRYFFCICRYDRDFYPSFWKYAVLHYLIYEYWIIFASLK